MRDWRFWLLVLAGGVLVLVLLAPTALGRIVGGLWVAVMSAIIGLIEPLVGG